MAPYREPLTAAHFERNPPPVAALDIQLEAVASSFEVERAKAAYIPMLEACYALAHEMPFRIPDGYRVLGEVRSDVEELPELAPSPEAAAAVAADFEAARAAVSDPQAWGFVVMEESSGAILVCIRGTQTPREWLANFTAVECEIWQAEGWRKVKTMPRHEAEVDPGKMAFSGDGHLPSRGEHRRRR